MGADDSAIEKWADNLMGTPQGKLEKLHSLIVEMGNNRSKASQDFLDRRSGNKTDTKKLSIDQLKAKYMNKLVK